MVVAYDRNFLESLFPEKPLKHHLTFPCNAISRNAAEILTIILLQYRFLSHSLKLMSENSKRKKYFFIYSRDYNIHMVSYFVLFH
jgi:hypothetical protein